MALGDFEAFSPAESQYTQPGAAAEGARQSVLKKSRYLASMDQFYANLEESVRQYNKTYKLQEAELSLRTKEQADVSAYRQESLDVQREQIGASSDWYSKQYELGMARIESGEKIARLETKSRDPYSGRLVPPGAQFTHTSDKPVAEEAGTGGQIPLSWLETQLGGGLEAPTSEGVEYRKDPSGEWQMY